MSRSVDTGLSQPPYLSLVLEGPGVVRIIAPLTLFPPTMTIAAVVSPRERASLEAASAGCFAVVHRSTLPEALKAVRERPIDAVVLSVHQCPRDEEPIVDRLVHAFPDIPTVVLVTRQDPAAAELLLRLGATGVRQVVDVTQPAGWIRLREVLAEPASRPAARILSALLAELPELPPEARVFIEVIVRLAPSTPVVRSLSHRVRLRPSTLVSRFTRASLPSPKTYLAGIRLLYAAQYFECEGLSIADVAYRLDYSSPQSFGRHLRAMLGITPSEFRRRFPFDVALRRFLGVLVVPYRNAWASFRPLEGARRERLLTASADNG